MTGHEKDKALTQDEQSQLVTASTAGGGRCNSCGLDNPRGTQSCPSCGTQLMVADRTGTVLGERYEFLNLIGEGGMSAVYRARHIQLSNKFVAIKLMHPRFISSNGFTRFEREAQAASNLDHPGIVAVHDFGQIESNQPYIVMDFVAGESLAQLLKREPKMGVQTAIEIIIQCADALTHAHEKAMVHRDIKPSNIMLKAFSDQKIHIQIIDFGIAKMTATDDGRTLTQTGELVGSPAYMSPEQCMGRQVDTRSDIYSLGCVFYELLTGQPPFAGSGQMEVIFKHLNDDPPSLPKIISRQLPKGVETLLFKMLEKNPDHRFATMMEVSRGLQKLRLRAPSSGPSLRISKRARRMANLAVVALSVFALILVGYLIQTPRVSEKIQSTGPSTSSGAVRTRKDIAISPRPSLLNKPSLITDDYIRDYVAPRIDLTEFDLTESQITDAALKELAKHPRLFDLKLTGTQITDRGVTCLAGAPLSALSLSGTKISDAALDALRESEIDSLDISKTQITDAVVSSLASMGYLTTLSIGGTKITDTGLTTLASLPKLSSLDLTGASITDVGVKALKASPHLEALTLDKTKISAASAHALSTFPRLQVVSLEYTPIDDNGVKALSKMPTIKELYLSSTRVTPASLPYLKRMQLMSKLWIGGNHSFSDGTIKQIAQLTQLQELSLDRCGLTAKSIPDLSQLKHLSTLYIGHNGFTPTDIKKLQAALPHCTVSEE